MQVSLPFKHKLRAVFYAILILNHEKMKFFFGFSYLVMQLKYVFIRSVDKERERNLDYR